MKQTKAESHWQAFYATGRVAEYLAYKKASSEEISDEIFHQRIDHTGASRGGIGSAGDRSDP